MDDVHLSLWNLKFFELLSSTTQMKFTYYHKIWNFLNFCFSLYRWYSLTTMKFEIFWSICYHRHMMFLMHHEIPYFLMVFTHGQTMWFSNIVNLKEHTIFHVIFENRKCQYFSSVCYYPTPRWSRGQGVNKDILWVQVGFNWPLSQHGFIPLVYNSGDQNVLINYWYSCCKVLNKQLTAYLSLPGL